ncbi:MAG: acylphosphatase [Thermoplasmatales archaeon]|nr:acylphosphatase [Candidatus Thermoplasmatota archaeon]MCG2825682.1 acylphosphatase [Thermoplasmatales archaeon]
MIRARINVKGRVQDVGYRTIVKQIARGFGIKGLVRNAENGSVEIFCETDRETLDEFKKTIDIKSPPEDLFGVNVENIDEHGEDTKNYVNPPEKFEYFHIDYLNEDLLKTSVERAEIGILAFKAMHKDLKEGQDDLKEGQDKMIGKQDKTIAAIKGLDKKQDKMIKGQDKMLDKQDKTIEVISNRFNNMDTKYGDIAKTLNSVNDKLDFLARLFEKLVNHIVKEEK